MVSYSEWSGGYNNTNNHHEQYEDDLKKKQENLEIIKKKYNLSADFKEEHNPPEDSKKD